MTRSDLDGDRRATGGRLERAVADPLRRCAVYTRTSTEEGLGQTFNSLDAQYEACAAYIRSQQGEGWRLTPARYDDGGYSGGTLARPGLQALLADIDAGQVDVVVVYKIDRLTRSLADFAKIVERLDARQASFVSVTQAFSTTTSMGRLTLNVLLSFAQFERELGAERVRDKMAASRRRGMWMGGVPPLGYDIQNRRLVINNTEAASIRWIFARYLDVRSLPRLAAEIEKRGITTKRYLTRSGRMTGGNPRWSISKLQYLLRNRTYAGQVVHKGDVWPGQHEAMIERSLFESVQAQLSAGCPSPRRGPSQKSPAWLTGLVYDDRGHRMTPQATTKRGKPKAYIYYVSQALLQRRPDPGSRVRFPAGKLDRLVGEVLEIAHAAGCTAASGFRPDRDDARRGIEHSRDTHGDSPARHLPHDLRQRVRQVVVGDADIAIDLSGFGDVPPSGLRRGLASLALNPAIEDLGDGLLRIRLGLPLPDRGDEAAGRERHGARSGRDPALMRALVRAHRWRKALEDAGTKGLDEAIRASGFNRTTARKLLRLAFLAPALQDAILEGRQPRRLTVRSVLRKPLSSSWQAQCTALAFHPRDADQGAAQPNTDALHDARA